MCSMKMFSVGMNSGWLLSSENFTNLEGGRLNEEDMLKGVWRSGIVFITILKRRRNVVGG